MKRSKKITIIVVLALLSLGAASLYALGTNHHANKSMFGDFISYRVDRELEQLNLTQEQMKKTTQLRSNIRNKIQSLIQGKQQTRKLVMNELKKAQIDRQAIKSIIDRRIAELKKTSYTISDNFIDFLELLTQEQKQQLVQRIKELKTQRQQRIRRWMQ